MEMPTPQASVMAGTNLVISQVYGGGGNSGATYRNDFIEVFNPTSAPISVSGWSVQYASATGSTWQKTDLSGVVAPGGYYLVQQAAGAGGTVSLPTPDATGTIAMGATGGKVALVNNTTLLSGTCPTGTNVVDMVGFNSTANCGWIGAALSNTLAALRLNDGCTDGPASATTFTTGAPTPRNSSSPLKDCNAVDPGVTVVTVVPATAQIDVADMQEFTATAANNTGPVTTTFTWESSNPAVATIDASGNAIGVSAGTVTITARAASGESGTASLTVLTPEPMPDMFITEIHYDDAGTDEDEQIEIEGPADYNLSGWKIVLYNGSNGASYATYPLSGNIPSTCGARGVVVIPTPGIQNGSPDGIALVSPSNRVLEFLSYEGTMTATNGAATGMVSVDIGVSQNGSAEGNSLQKGMNGWYADLNSFGACNPAVPPVRISISGRTSGDAPLPVGFEDQVFVRLTQGGVEIPMSFTLTSETPSIMSVDENGVVRALSAGIGVLRATAESGATRTFSLATAVATASTTAQYGHNTEFGEPVDGNAADDFIIRRDQFTSSFNPARGIPNWVAYNIDATHFGALDRCDCFTYDPELVAAGFSRYTTADYTGAGAAAGYGIDRGHLARSFDRTAGTLDNARTFYFSNIIPQASANNQGPWSSFEIFLGDKARFENKEVFVIAGASGSKGTVKNEGKITIPEFTWKVAVIMPRDQGLADVQSAADVEVVAVIMPNGPVINGDWNTYRVSVDAVEALSGYDVLALLEDGVEAQVEGTFSRLAEASALVNQLVAAGVFDKQDGNWMTLKLDLAAKELQKGNRIPAQNQVEEVLRKVVRVSGAEALVQLLTGLRAAM